MDRLVEPLVEVLLLPRGGSALPGPDFERIRDSGIAGRIEISTPGS